jgi:hypothetical protein
LLGLNVRGRRLTYHYTLLFELGKVDPEERHDAMAECDGDAETRQEARQMPT